MFKNILGAGYGFLKKWNIILNDCIHIFIVCESDIFCLLFLIQPDSKTFTWDNQFVHFF